MELFLYDETIHQKLDNGLSFIEAVNKKGIIAGIKVDKGAKDLAVHEGEKVTEGLDGLRDRLVQYAAMGLKFAKWRAVITIGNNIPSHACIESNAHALARYAALCQENNIVPIIEPEVLMNGSHTLEDSKRQQKQRSIRFSSTYINKELCLRVLFLSPTWLYQDSTAPLKTQLKKLQMQQ